MIDTDINETLHEGDVSSGIGLLNSHTLPQANKSSKANEMNMSVYNGNDNVDYCYINISTVSGERNHNSIDYTDKRDEISTNKYLRGNNGLTDGIDIDDILPASALNKYANTEYNNEHHNLQSNVNFSTSNNSSVSTLNSPFVTSTNE